MTNDQAQSAIVTSAVLVGAIYMYRRMVDPAPVTDAPHTPSETLRQLAGTGPTAPLGRFITGWGFTYLTLAAVAEPAPDVAGGLAWLVLLGTILGNGRELSRTLQHQLRETRTQQRAAAHFDSFGPTIDSGTLDGLFDPSPAPIISAA